MSKTHLPLAGGHATGFGATRRNDTWWLGPVVTLTVLLGFIVYSTWAGTQGQHYYYEPYLSPMYSPLIFTDPTLPGSGPVEHAWLGSFPEWWPWFVPRSPSVIIVVFPLLFRVTCYYYRKAYYRAFVGSPPACAVGPLDVVPEYKGETYLLLVQNLHRYALYPAVAYIGILYYDAFVAFFKHGELGFGVGSFVLLLNATLLGGYTFGCHSFRHIIGGHDDCMSCGQNTLKYGAWQKANWLNARHMYFAWCSLVWVGFTDFYVRAVSMGIITDLNTWD